MPLFIDYRISGTGWVDVTLGDGQQQISGNVSYIHDSLSNLADVAVSITHQPAYRESCRLHGRAR